MYVVCIYIYIIKFLKYAYVCIKINVIKTYNLLAYKFSDSKRYIYIYICVCMYIYNIYIYIYIIYIY